jgi:adenine/guanine phosphoribosyltransferase-like PRPP-binding protein
MVILEDKRPFLLSKEYKEYLPKWIQKMIHPEKDDERNNINEKIKYIPEFLSMKNTTEE